MILKNNKQKGFTIVELLIVIVVIGILAAISIVAYNGIQNRARDTAVKNAASQVRTKVESWNSIKGSYPTMAQITPGGLTDSDAQEAKLDAEVVARLTSGTIAGAHGTTGANTVLVAPCPATGTQTGVKITYYQSGTNGVFNVGTGC